MGEVGEITSYDYEDGSVIINYSVSEEYINFDFVSENEEFMKENLMAYLQNGDKSMRALFDELSRVHAGLSMVYTGKETGRTYTVNISRDEINGLSRTKKDDPLAALQSQLTITNAQLPTKIDEGMMMTSVRINNDYVEYLYECDEDLLDMDIMQDNSTDLKQDILESLSDPEDKVIQRECKMMKDANVGCKYIYVGNQTGKRVVVTIECDEL